MPLSVVSVCGVCVCVHVCDTQLSLPQSPMIMQLKTIMKQKNRAAWVQESQKKKMALSKEMFLPVTVCWNQLDLLCTAALCVEWCVPFVCVCSS